MRPSVTAALVLVLATTGASAQQFRTWKDEKGKIHYSNIGPSGPLPSSPPADGTPDVSESGETPSRAPAGEDAAVPGGEAPAAAGAPAEKEEGPYAGLSADELSGIATRERTSLRRDLVAAKARIRAIDEELASIQEKRQRAAAKAVASLGGISAPPAYVASPEEERLFEAKKKEEEKVKETRDKYAELQTAVEKRSGGLPEWWLPLD